MFGVGSFGNGVFSVQNFVHTFHRGHTLGNVVSSFRKILERLNDAVQNHHVEDKRRGVNRRMVAENERSTIPKHHDNEYCAQKFAHGVRRGLTNRHAVRSIAKLVGAAVKAFGHFAFGRKGFDNAHTAQGFFKLRHGVAPFVLGIEAFVFEFTADASHHPAHEGEYDEGKERELPRHVNQHAEVANQQNGVFNQHFERAGYRRFDFVHVAAHARNDVALAFV